MDSNKVVIKQKLSVDRNLAKIFIDDVEIHGVTFVNFTSSVEEIPRITLEFLGQDVEIEIEEDTEE